MRLLPNKVGTDVTGTLPSVRANHLRPSYTRISLVFCSFFSVFKDIEVIIHLLFQDITSLPQRKMNCMPPMHLQVKFTEPTVICESCLCRRNRSAAIYFCQIFRQDDTSFKFACSWISTF